MLVPIVITNYFYEILLFKCIKLINIFFYLGVHGGLIVYDDRFTSDLLADILFIQQNKTLLRRHLSIQFNQLIGKDLNQKKRDTQCTPKYKPLTISSKIKVSS